MAFKQYKSAKYVKLNIFTSKRYKNFKTTKNKSKRIKFKKIKSKKIRRKMFLKGGIRQKLEQGIFSLMTFNVEVFLNLYNYNIKENKIITCVNENTEKIKNFKNLFNGIDIVCLQETDLPGREPYPIFKNPLENDEIPKLNLEKKSICKSEELDWNKLTFVYGTPSYLANAIYVASDITTKEPHNGKINSVGVERCFSSVTIEINGKNIIIASVHLVGGRFDDKKAIEEDTNEKLNEVTKVVEQVNPDIICGDFNTKIRRDTVTENTDNYFHSLLPEGLSKKEINEYKKRWDKWIYIDEIENYLSNNGYKLAYYDSNGNVIPELTDTSAYGGIVDMIYYKPEKLSVVEGSVSIVGEEIVMEKNPGTNMYTPLLSDHFPVKAEFKVI